MKKLLAILLLCAPLAAQTCTPSASQNCTPNVSLALPVRNSQSWDTALNSNFTLLDNLLSAGSAIPGISAKSLNKIITVDGTLITTIPAAINALPSCTIAASTWNHCGVILIPPGTYTVSSTISITSPFIWIIGEGVSATTINYTGTTGAAFDWTSSPFNAQDNTSAGGLVNVLIDGTAASAGTSGVHYYDVTGLHLSHIQINNFAGSGSSCLWQDAVTRWTERSSVEATLYNCATGWKQTTQAAATGSTLGYGVFDLRINTLGTQTAISSTGNSPNTADFSQNTVHIVINGDSTTGNGITLARALWYSNGGMIHMEHEQTGVTTDANSTFFFLGPVDESTIPNSLNASSHVNFFSGTSGFLTPFSLQPFSTGNANLLIGANSDCGATNAAFLLCAPTGNSTDILQISHAGVVQWDFLSSSAPNTTFLQPSGTSGNKTITFPDATGKLATVNPITFPESTAPSGSASNEVCYGDSSAHALKCSYNNGTFFNVPLVGLGNTWTGTQTLNAPPVAGGSLSVAGTGACATVTTTAGGSWAGTFKCTGTTGASTITITPGITAPNGFICSVFDETTRANLAQQTSHNATTCVLTATSITQNDVFVFQATAF